MPSRNQKKRSKQRAEYLQKREDILSQENKAKARARYKADPEKKKASVRDTYKADPEKKKASVRDTYKADPVPWPIFSPTTTSPAAPLAAATTTHMAPMATTRPPRQ
ncbi:hypothetical protein EMCRGX_G023530 [Ephydatia muelleri]